MSKQNTHKKLNVTKEAKHRIMVGLGWEPAAPDLLQKIACFLGIKKSHHDLDLACYIFGEGKNFIERVSAESVEAIDQTGHIYHSGDNIDGIGDGDDEEISAELKDIPSTIHHLIFTADIRTGHIFYEIDDAQIRLVDGYTDHCFLDQKIDHEEGKDKHRFAFVHIYRNGDEWMLHHICDYICTEDGAESHMSLHPYLNGAA